MEDNVNINRTFSIDDIENQEKLHRFFSIGDEIDIHNILEDSELLIENTEKFIGKIDAVIQNGEIAKVTFTDEPVVIEDTSVENISIEITDDNEKTDVSNNNETA